MVKKFIDMTLIDQLISTTYICYVLSTKTDSVIYSSEYSFKNRRFKMTGLT